MIRSDDIDLIATALAKAQKAMSNAKFDSTNPHFKSKYASLASVIDSIKAPLADNGLAYSQSLTGEELTTLLIHSSGQWLGSIFPIIISGPKTSQSFGSALTYAKRYSLASLVGIASDEDDDANSAAAAPVANKYSSTRQVQPATQPAMIPFDWRNDRDVALIKKCILEIGINKEDASAAYAQLQKLELFVNETFLKSRLKHFFTNEFKPEGKDLK